MADCWVDLQVSVISEITHSYVRSYSLRLQRGVNFWFLRQLLLPKPPADLPPPFFMQNYHHVQPTILSVGIFSDLREVSISDFWDSYYQPTDKIMPDLPPPDFVQDYHQAQHTVLSVGVVSDITKVSIADCWDSYYQPNPLSIFHLLFCAEFSSGTMHSSVRWNSLRVKKGFNFWFWRQLLSTDRTLPRSPTPYFRVELSSDTTHRSFHWNRLRVQRGINLWLLRQLLFTKSSPYPPHTVFEHNP